MNTMARGINSAGHIVGTYAGVNGPRGFLYSDGSFSNIDVPGATLTTPSAINSAGQIVGFYDHHGFLFEYGNFSTIDVPGATSTQALGINDVGQIVGTYTDARGEHGFLYRTGTFSTIDFPGATFTFARGINNAGEIVGTYTDANSRVRGFLYRGGAFSSPEALPDGLTLARGIDDSGNIVGASGFLYRGELSSPIDVPGAVGKTEPEGINNAGQITGFYFDASGMAHGFLATPIAQPSPMVSGATAGVTPAHARQAVARVTGRTLPRPSGAATCNVAITVANVQHIINEALGTTTVVDDLSGDGAVNVVDLQDEIDAVLACTSTGPGGTSAVAHLTVQSGNGQAACVCIAATLQAFQPISVKATDVNGNPVAGASVGWRVTSGQITFANSATSATSTTDGSGVASVPLSMVLPSYFATPFDPYLVSSIQATSNSISAVFTETFSLITSGGSSIIYANPPTFGGAPLANAPLSGNVGATLTTPILVRVLASQVASAGLPVVSVRLSNQQASPALTCAPQAGSADPGSVLSDVQGNASCYPVFSGSGTGTFTVLIGGVSGNNVCSSGTAPCYLQKFGPFTFTSIGGPPAAVQIVSGNNQVGAIGTQLAPLVAKLVDGAGNAIQGQTMVWTVVPAGAASLTYGTTVTDNNGELSTGLSLARLASAGATITVSLLGNSNVSATFHATIPNPLTAMNKISGDNQTAQVGVAFANPLVLQLLPASGPVAFFTIPCQVTGPVSIVGGSTVYTDANGIASFTVKAGASAGTATITAVAGALTQTFTLTVQ